MSPTAPTQHSAPRTRPTPPTAAATLRKLYFLRFGFAAVWAALLFTTADALGPLSATLLVLYPAFDVACAIVDIRSTRANGGPVRGLYANVALSTLTAIGLTVAATSGIPAVLHVWGAWAVTAGLVQLTVGAARRRMGGQWAMIASGAISTLAGASFIAQANSGDTALTSLSGYAFLGGVFFLATALRLNHTPTDA
ncbi:hypothetical protein [Streptomyces californicus]|uniref:hypothetical protein n=1 Tax=Streptomyces californicus TaxID=67351 RepID=UPI0004C089FF|nr:hypothetical protein [Streptomyces californicus]QRV54724.1 hypothetical protein I6J40_11215 [Streptomyces californicus]